MRLIDVDALRKKLIALQVRCKDPKIRQGIDDGLHYYMPKILEEFPTIEAEPVKHSKWIYKNGLLCCKTCGFHPTYSLDTRKGFSNANYCPNCGGYMRGDNIG